MPDNSAHCVVTSPPFLGLRDYGVDGQLGLESTLEEYIYNMVGVFRSVRRCLRADGTCWINMGDCYASGGGTGHQGKHGQRCNRSHTQRNLKRRVSRTGSIDGSGQPASLRADEAGRNAPSLKPKDLCGAPWRLALALQADGWYLRCDIIWHKPNPMPESVSDRPTKAHEYLFLLSKSERYYYDKNAIQERAGSDTHARCRKYRASAEHKSSPTAERNGIRAGVNPKARLAPVAGWARGTGLHSAIAHNRGPRSRQNASYSAAVVDVTDFRNKQTVWTIPTQAYQGAHFATFPEELVRLCVLAGCPPGGTVLDPFAGTGTTGIVALKLGRNFLGLEISLKYCQLARTRLAETCPLLALDT